MKIAFISPFYNIEEYANDIVKEFPSVEFAFCCDGLERMDQFAAEKESEGFDAIISRGGTHTTISKFITIPNVNSEASIYDLIDVLDKVRADFGEKEIEVKIIVYYLNTFLDDEKFVEKLEKLFNIKIKVLKFSSYQNFDDYWVSNITAEDVVIGAKHAMQFCIKKGYRGYPLDAGLATLKKAVREAIDRANARRNDIIQRKHLSLMLSYSSDGILFLNSEGIIIMTNAPAKKAIRRIFGYYPQEGAKLKDPVLRKSIELVLKDNLPLWDQVYSVIEEVTILYNVQPITVNNETKEIIISFREAGDIIRSGNRIREELRRRGCNARYTLDDIVGESEAIKRCKINAKKFGMYDSNVLIQGETGTGKELFAQAIHNCSKRCNKPFYGINCMSFPESLLESELFGYSEGSFTGAVKGGKAGLFELADGGTVFLDEIGEMPLTFQSKLLRVLQEKEIRRIGDDKVIRIDVRIIAASHRDLMVDVEEGKFREDLYYRLNVLNLIIPTLKERKEDIGLLLHQFVNYYRSTFEKSGCITFETEALNYLKAWSWKGNVRELQNFAERVCVYCDDEKPINIETIKSILKGFGDNEMQSNDTIINDNAEALLAERGGALDDNVYHLVLEAIEKFDGNKTKAASYLGVSRTFIWRKLKEYQN